MIGSGSQSIEPPLEEPPPKKWGRRMVDCVVNFVISTYRYRARLPYHPALPMYLRIPTNRC
jgi:hypothetical protein